MLAKYGELLLADRQRAALAALLTSVIPFLGWISLVIIALVTLRKGYRDGLWVTLWASVPALLLALRFGPLFAVTHVVGGSLFVWLMAWLLRDMRSWAMVLQVTALLGVLAVIVVHVLVPDLVSWWHHTLTQYAHQLEGGLTSMMSASQQTQVAQVLAHAEQDNGLFYNMARMASGFTVAIVLFSNLVNLLLGRWWQSVLYNPEGLKHELYRLRLGYASVALLLLVVLGMVLQVNIAWDMIFLVTLGFVPAALSLVHAVVAKSPQPILWLVLVYAALILPQVSPYMLVLLIGLGVLDSMVDIRTRANVLS